MTRLFIEWLVHIEYAKLLLIIIHFTNHSDIYGSPYQSPYQSPNGRVPIGKSLIFCIHSTCSDHDCSDHDWQEFKMCPLHALHF